MPKDPEYLVALFPSITHVMRSERILIEERIAHKLVPTPKRVSSECGVCIRFLATDREGVLQALSGRAEPCGIRPMP